MLARLSGILEAADEDSLTISTGGGAFAFIVLTPRTLAEELADRVGENVTLHTLTYLEASAQGAHMTPRLVGFASAEDRAFFELFTTVKGVGAKKALKAMTAPIPEIAMAIAERNARALQQLPNIGKRLAETVIAELHGKVERFAAGEIIEAKGSIGTSGLSGAAQEAIAALERLGETSGDAERMVRRALEVAEDLGTPDEILAAAYGLRGE